MIFIDKFKLPADQTFDGMDSAVRISILCLPTSIWRNKWVAHLMRYAGFDGVCVRQPEVAPCNNPKNFTRDQLMMLVMGLDSTRDEVGHKEILKAIFYAHLKRLFFCQNFERDVVGSKKYLWPHKFYKDSKPNPKTFLWWFGGYKIPDEGTEIESRIIDFADPLTISDICCLAFAARIWWLMPLAPIMYLNHFINLVFNGVFPSWEQNQAIAKSSVFKTLWIYKRITRLWRESLFKYWSTRNEIEYATILLGHVEGWKAPKVGKVHGQEKYQD